MQLKLIQEKSWYLPLLSGIFFTLHGLLRDQRWTFIPQKRQVPQKGADVPGESSISIGDLWQVHMCSQGVPPFPQSRVLMGLVWTTSFSQPTSSVVPAKVEKFQSFYQHLSTQSVTQWWAELLRTFLCLAVVKLQLTQAGQQPAAH